MKKIMRRFKKQTNVNIRHVQKIISLVFMKKKEEKEEEEEAEKNCNLGEYSGKTRTLPTDDLEALQNEKINLIFGI